MAVVRASFPRNRGEFNIGLFQLSSINGTPGDGNRLGGLPSDTASLPGAVDGWVRWEWEMLTTDVDVTAGALETRVYVVSIPLLFIQEL